MRKCSSEARHGEGKTGGAIATKSELRVELEGIREIRNVSLRDTLCKGEQGDRKVKLCVIQFVCVCGFVCVRELPILCFYFVLVSTLPASGLISRRLPLHYSCAYHTASLDFSVIGNEWKTLSSYYILEIVKTFSCTI